MLQAGKDDFTIKVEVQAGLGLDKQTAINVIKDTLNTLVGGSAWIYEHESKIAREYVIELTTHERVVVPTVIMTPQKIAQLETLLTDFFQNNLEEE